VFSFTVQGVLDGAGFPARVTAHFVAVEGQARPRTTILIKFAEEVFYFSSFRSFRSITSFVCVKVFDAIFLKLALLKTRFRSIQHGVGPHERDVLGDQF